MRWRSRRRRLGFGRRRGRRQAQLDCVGLRRREGEESRGHGKAKAKRRRIEQKWSAVATDVYSSFRFGVLFAFLLYKKIQVSRFSFWKIVNHLRVMHVRGFLIPTVSVFVSQTSTS